MHRLIEAMSLGFCKKTLYKKRVKIKHQKKQHKITLRFDCKFARVSFKSHICTCYVHGFDKCVHCIVILTRPGVIASNNGIIQYIEYTF